MESYPPRPLAVGEKRAWNSYPPLLQPPVSRMVRAIYGQTVQSYTVIRKTGRKADGPLINFGRWLLDNQTGVFLSLSALFVLVHTSTPEAQSYTFKFLTISHYNPQTGKYALGADDVYFILFCTILLTGLRAGIMNHILAPLAKAGGITKKKEIARFAEQGFLVIHYGIFWSIGVYIYTHSPFYLNMSELWTNWPQRDLSGLTKFYILAQLSFYLQQVVAINFEDRRKDHWQMCVHHVVTIALLWGAYAYHQTRIGTLILILMDNGDILLGIAKCLKYLDFSTVCDYMFGLFIVSWAICRHGFYLVACWSLYAESLKHIPAGCSRGPDHDLTGPFEHETEGWGHLLAPFTDGQGTVCWNENITTGFLVTLLFLQVVQIVWFVLILKVAIRVIKGTGAEDVRSDSEEEFGETEEIKYEQQYVVEKEVGVEQIDLNSWERRKTFRGAKGSGSLLTVASGVSLPGPSG
ncbi:TLC domain-containing protein [Pseudomassariella vexata]|uniref:TLC domain-domain-containing protein n=1 Tax=Pseudomassariella vexata TaxID=1141098 RepID=A0A1Y2E7K3_9PEZI|nr:TLC domain-containing protein [Pseudomassariella vexata]ORY67522.1 TLC domain-domain-containing protein [Pseudomassariella vexata]